MGNDPRTEPVSVSTIRVLFCTAEGQRQVYSEELGDHRFLSGTVPFADAIKECRQTEESRRRFGNGKMTFGDAVQIYRDKLAVNPDLKPKSKLYYWDVLDFIGKFWPSVPSR